MSKDSCLKLQVHLVNTAWQTVFLEQRILQVPTSPVQAMVASKNSILFPGYTIVSTYLAYLIYQFQDRQGLPAARLIKHKISTISKKNPGYRGSNLVGLIIY